MKMKMKMKNRSHRYDINRSRYENRYTEYTDDAYGGLYLP